MSMNLMSIRDRVAFRVGHVSVAYKGTVLLWGGLKGYQEELEIHEAHIFPTDELCIFDCEKETWHIRMLTGDIPPKLSSPGAAVLDDALYVYGGFQSPTNPDGEDLYKLDLSTLRWQKLNPKGIPPVACDKMAAWSYGKKVYFFGGFGKLPDFHNSNKFDYVVDDGSGHAWNNQLVAYNPETDRWEWPVAKGNTPHPRAAHASDISGCEVYIMGGRVLDIRMSGLYCLNMETMTWSDNLTLATPNDPIPDGRSWHTLTFFAPDKAVVYGGWNSGAETLDDCWILETKRPVSFRLFGSIFDSRRFWHQVVYNPITGDLICTGGSSDCWVLTIQREPKKCFSWFPYPVSSELKSRRCHSAVPINDFDANKQIIILGGYINPEEPKNSLDCNRPYFPRHKGRRAYYEENVPGFIVMSLLPKSLLRLSVDAVLEGRERTRPFWNQLPNKLRCLLVARDACEYADVDIDEWDIIT